MSRTVSAAAGLVLVLAALGTMGIGGLVPADRVERIVGHLGERDVAGAVDDVQTLFEDLLGRAMAGLETDDGPSETCDSAYATVADRPIDLDLHELLGGHTLDRHVGRTDDWLRQRLATYTRLDAASSFEDQATAEHLIGQAVTCRQAAIARWLAGDRPTEAISADLGLVTGRSMIRDADHSVLVDGVTLVLRRHPSAPGGVMILTAYPDGGD